MTPRVRRRLVPALLAVILIPAAPRLALADVEAPGGERTELTADMLINGTVQPDGPVHNDWFMPVGEAAPSLHAFSGTLVWPGTATKGFDIEGPFDGWAPPFEVGFISHEGDLIPTNAGLIANLGDPTPWYLTVSPGRVWSEPSDGGLSRASFPFSLVGGEWMAEAHNGIATFVFDDDMVSDVVFQVVQQTSPDHQFVGFGRLDAMYRTHTADNAEALIASFERDRASRLPVRPIADLENGLSARALTSLKGLQTNVPISATGVVLDGVLYLGVCETDYGAFPYCEEMRHSVYSVTKSLAGMVSLLYLAQKYGDEVFDLRVKDILDVNADHDGWNEVTLADLLSMASGIGEAGSDRDGRIWYSEDEDAPTLIAFLAAETASGKLDASFAGSNYDWGPGEVFRYRNMDSFILAAAMDALVKEHEGPDASLWASLTRDVLQPIGVMTLPKSHTREADGSPGIPFMAAGVFPNVHDVAKIATLLQNGGMHDGVQLLSRQGIDAALYRDDTIGIPIGSGGTQSYNLSMWHYRLWVPACFVDVASMRGYGGNYVFLLPNGVTLFRFSDDRLGVHSRLAEAAHEIRSLCPDEGSAQP